MTFEVAGVQTQIAGTTTDVPGSGSSSNYDSNTTVGDFAVFDINSVNSEGSKDFADLRVTYSADNGEIGSDIMIAQTTDSQGRKKGSVQLSMSFKYSPLF